MGVLERLVLDFARAIEAVDAHRPIAQNKRNGAPFQPGLGPHSEAETLELIVKQVRLTAPDWYVTADRSVSYPSNPRQKCDLRITSPRGNIVIEGKLLRLKGDNGNPNDNMLMHILSPYPHHRSALTDTVKLATSQFLEPKAIIIIAYNYPDLPFEPAIGAFEILAKNDVGLGPRQEAEFNGLCHPIHKTGTVIGWEVLTRQETSDSTPPLRHHQGPATRQRGA
jgi:hypothetical protein